MNDFEKAKHVRRALAIRAAEGYLYEKWSDEFARSQIAAQMQRLVDEFRGIAITGFTTKECDDLEFGRWFEETPLRLIPLYLYPFLKYGEVLTCIDGSTVTVGPDYKDHDKSPRRDEEGNKIDGYEYIDNDHRGGSLAYGIIPNE